MIKRENLSELLSFDPEGYLTTTLYLQIDGNPQAGYAIELKDFIKARKNELDSQKLNSKARDSVNSDLKKIQDYVTLEFSREGVRTLVIFSCAGKKWWKVLTLSLPLRSHLEIHSKPYVGPLTYIFDKYSRFLCILVERAKARMFEVFAGEILEHTDILDDVPGKVKKAGFGGYEERRIERHIEDHVRRHYKHAAEAALNLDKKYQNDHVILGGTEQNTNEFRHFLHSTLQDKVVGTFLEDINANPKAVLERTMQIEQEIKEEEERKLLQRFLDQVNSGGLGIVGLDPTLKALQQGQVHYLVVKDGYGTQGYRCKNCQSLHSTNGRCQYCDGTVENVGDIVEEAVREALEQGCQVRYITLPQGELSPVGNIGAILRFKA